MKARDVFILDAAGDDAREMIEVGADIDREAMGADPVAQSDSDGGDFFIFDPNAGLLFAPLADEIKGGEGEDDPIFDLSNEAADITSAAVQIKHKIDDALAGPMISHFSTAPSFIDREAVYI